MNNPAKAKRAGRNCNVRSTIAPAAPISFALAANEPANMKIHTISSRSLLPAPCEKIATRSLNFMPRSETTATIAVRTKMSNNGALLTPPVYIDNTTSSTSMAAMGLNAINPRISYMIKSAPLCQSALVALGFARLAHVAPMQ